MDDLLVLGPGAVLGQVIRSLRDGGMACHEVYYQGGLRLQKHAHESAFFGLAIDGGYHEIVGAEEFEYASRSVIYHPPGESHSIAVSRAGLRCFVLELDAGEIESRYAIRLPVSMVQAKGGPLAALMTTAYREFRHPDACSSLAIQGLLLQLVVSASRADVDCGHEYPQWLDRVNDLLQAQFRARLTLDEIAAEVGVAPARISAVFRRAHRCSLAEEQRRLRIEFACRQLLRDDASLADIALGSGFADQPHFARTFKIVTGMTPTQYRAMVKQRGGRPVGPSSVECS